MTRRFSWINPKVEVRDSGINGKGLFAKEDISKGETISVCGGIIVSSEEVKKMKKEKKDFFVKYSIPVSDEFFLISGFSEKDLEPDDFYNHSCSPNCVLKNDFIIIAFRNIKKGEELTLDYATIEDREDFVLECNCGSKDCRKIIRGSDWKLPEVQEKYKGHFSSHIQSKIDSLKKQKITA
jgi:SET domain-containing protein